MPFQYAFKHHQSDHKYDFGKSIMFGCSGAKTKMEIFPDGSVYACGLYYGVQKYKYPKNIHENSIDCVWESGAKMRGDLLQKSKQKDCKCKLSGICELCPYIMDVGGVTCPLKQ